MKYEIINPSDECYISSDNEKVAMFCTLFAGEGRYALNKKETNEEVLPLFLFGGADEFIQSNFGDVKTFTKDNIDEIIKCLESFEYAREQTSLNNIKEQFNYLKKMLIKNYKDKEAK